MSNSLDPDQAVCFVGPDLGPFCLQRLSAGNMSRQRDRVVLVIRFMHLQLKEIKKKMALEIVVAMPF